MNANDNNDTTSDSEGSLDSLDEEASTLLELLNYEVPSSADWNPVNQISRELASCFLADQSEHEMKLINTDKNKKVLHITDMQDKSCGSENTFRDTGTQFALQSYITLNQYTQNWPDTHSKRQQTSYSSASQSTQICPETNSENSQTNVIMTHQSTQSLHTEISATKATSLRPAYLNNLNETTIIPEIKIITSSPRKMSHKMKSNKLSLR